MSTAAQAAAYYAKNKDKKLAQLREAYAANPEHRLRKQRERRARDPGAYASARHGIVDPESVTPRPDACEVCGSVGRRMCIDHDHGTGKFRGWLCHQCNIALGHAGDSVDILKKLAAYLERKA